MLHAFKLYFPPEILSDKQNITHTNSKFLNNSLHSHVQLELIPFGGGIVNVTQQSLSLDKADARNKAPIRCTSEVAIVSLCYPTAVNGRDREVITAEFHHVSGKR